MWPLIVLLLASFRQLLAATLVAANNQLLAAIKKWPLIINY
jgi:hypothetical protein